MPNQEEYTDETIISFGMHKGTKLGNLPDHYCRWLLSQNWIKNKHNEKLYAYLKDNEELFAEDEKS